MKELKDFPGYYVTEDGKIFSKRTFGPQDNREANFRELILFQKQKTELILLH